ncbi:hypothetical protein [Mesorhizobium sp. M0058]|uniref:hypothetical protein n=1 Tax=Mesorhizobium sp. M0058 TaxID=2956865 RepID=UPI003339A53D
MRRIAAGRRYRPPGPQTAAAAFFGDAGARDYERQFLALLAHNQIGAIDRANGTGPFGHDRHAIANRDFQATYRTLEQLAKPVSAEQMPAGRGKPGEGHFNGRWRVSRQTLYVNAAARPSAPKTFSFSGLQARSVEVVLHQSGQQPVDILGACDGALAIRAGGGSRSVASGAAFRLRLSAGQTASLFPSDGLNRCSLKLSSSLAPAGAPLTILREEVAYPAIAALDSRYERCPVPDPSRLDKLASVFTPAAGCRRAVRCRSGHRACYASRATALTPRSKRCSARLYPTAPSTRPTPNCRSISRARRNSSWSICRRWSSRPIFPAASSSG